MHNDSEFLHCAECEMKKIEDTMWVPGLFAKLVSLAILAVLTTGANVFLIYIASRTKSLVSNTKVFVISLCFAHLLGSLIIIPLWIITRVHLDLAQNSPVFCQTAAFMWILMTLASFYSLSAISVDRFCIISNPMRYPVKATTPKKLFAVAAIWVSCAAFASAPEFGWGEYKFKPDAIPICGLDIRHSLSYALILLFFGFLAPLLIDIFCCARIIAIAMHQSRAIDSRKGSGSTVSISSSMSTTSSSNMQQPSVRLSKLKQKLNSLRLVFAGTGNFLICWLPYIVAHVWMTGIRNLSQDTESMPYILEFIVMCIALLNGFVNPVVIMFSNRDYTRRIKLLMFRRFGFFKDEIMEERSDNESSMTNLRRSQQYKSVNLIEIFQNMHQVADNIPAAVKRAIDNEQKSETNQEKIQISESCLSFENIKTPPVTIEITTVKDSNDTVNTNSLASERRRLMSQRSNSSSMDSENAMTPLSETFNFNLFAICENKDKDKSITADKIEKHVTIEADIPGLVIK